MTDFLGYSRNKDWKDFEQKLIAYAPRSATYRLSEVFVLIFREQLMTDSPEDPEAEDILNQSNWTYHTAFSIRKTTDLLDLICKFETGVQGRLDAVIKTRENQTLLVAEWEADYDDIFGQGKELEKLWKELNNSPGADGLLLTYCPTKDYFDFLTEVLENWHKRSFTKRPSLYLLVIGYKQQGRDELFEYLRTVEIAPDEVIVWDDLIFEKGDE